MMGVTLFSENLQFKYLNFAPFFLLLNNINAKKTREKKNIKKSACGQKSLKKSNAYLA